MKPLLLPLIACLLCGCREEHHTEPPPGFRIVCDKSKGLYAPAFGDVVLDGVKHRNRQSAIDHAWWKYRKLQKPGIEANWQECDHESASTSNVSNVVTIEGYNPQMPNIPLDSVLVEVVWTNKDGTYRWSKWEATRP